MRMAHTNRTCGSCLIAAQNNGVCPIFKQKMNPEEKGCPSHVSELNPCDICGQHMTKSFSLIDITNPEKTHKYCFSCQKLLSHCPTCREAQNCPFETDPSPIPKAVQKEFRQGNMVQIMTVKNPSRIEITCKKGCPCFSEEFGCCKEINTCSNWECVIDL